MDLGTRGHFYVPGDRIGDNYIVPPQPLTESALQDMGVPTRNFVVAANGFCIPDVSGGRGLSAVRHKAQGDERIQQTAESLASALLAMSRLPGPVWQQMSEHAAVLTERTKMGWKKVWQLLREGVYPADRIEHSALLEDQRHAFQIRQTPLVVADQSEDQTKSEIKDLVPVIPA